MKIYDIPLAKTPNQKVTFSLSGKNISVELNWRLNMLFASVSVNRVDVVNNRPCLNEEPIIRESYRGFPGEMWFSDLQGKENPDWRHLGERHVLRVAIV